MLNRPSTPFCAVLTAFLLLAAPTRLGAQTPSHPSGNDTEYSTLNAKATRFADHNEWASASAMLTLMLDLRPADAQLYSRAILAEGMRSRPQDQQRLLRSALEHGVSIDSLLTGVQQRSIRLGHADIYEDFLIGIPASFPWLKRSVDSYLLRYYTFRRNPQGMLTYATIMLQGLPDSEQFLDALASAQVQLGDFTAAMSTYERMLQINPSNLTALLALGNYYSMQQLPDKARPYLTRANTIAPTPYLTSLLTSHPLKKEGCPSATRPLL